MKQESFSDMEYRCRKKKTKREKFLEILDDIIPWDEWVCLTSPLNPVLTKFSLFHPLCWNQTGR